MTSVTQLRLLRLPLLMMALAGTHAKADAQSDLSPWRFGVTLGGGAFVGVVAEYWSDDFGVEARLGTFTFDDVSVRLSPKWRVGTWDGGEASWRVGVQWVPAGSSGDVYAIVHGVELAKVTDDGHMIGANYNLPLFGGGWRWGDLDTGSGDDPDTGDPEEGPEAETEDPELPSSWEFGSSVSIIVSFLLGELTYRYQPGG